MPENTQHPTIRTAQVADASTIAQIYINSWNISFEGLMPPKQLTNERIKRWERDIMMPPPQRWWVAELADTIIGFAGICPSRDPIDPDLGELNTIAVDPVWWRNGVGQALMSTAIRYLHTDGYSEAVLWTLANYERGQRFYESVGWSLDGGVRDQGRQVRYRLKLRKIITNPKTR